MDVKPELLGQSLLSSISDIAAVLDTEGRLVWWNDRLNEVTGYDDEALSERTGFDLLAPDERTMAKQAFLEVDEMSNTETREFDIRTPNGRVPYEFNGTLLRENDDVIGVAIVARDISRRKERERELRRRRDELETLNRVGETAYETIRAVVAAASREEIERAVCERLADSNLYHPVWIGREEADSIEPHTGVDTSDGKFLDRITALKEIEFNRPAEIALERGEPVVVQRVSESSLPDEAKELAEEYGIQSGLAVALAHEETTYGVLVVYSDRPDAFSEHERTAFKRLGELVGFAISAVHNERLLLSETVTELEIHLSPPESYLAELSGVANGPCYYEWTTPEGDGMYRHIVRVPGLDAERVRSIVTNTPNVVHCERVGSDGEEGIYEIVTEGSFARRLLEVGAFPSEAVAEDGRTVAIVEVPPDVDVRAVLAAANERYDAALVAKRERDRSVRSDEEYRTAVADRLTERQEEALRNAFFSGYFEWPRDVTAEDLAAELDLSSPTLHYHLRGAERALASAYFEYLSG